MSKEKAIQLLRDGLDFGGVCHVSTQTRQESEGDVLTIPAPVLLMMITELTAKMFAALEEIEPGQGAKYIEGSHDRIMGRIDAMHAQAKALEEAAGGNLKKLLAKFGLDENGNCLKPGVDETGGTTGNVSDIAAARNKKNLH
jgi:hypothetical protein